MTAGLESNANNRSPSGPVLPGDLRERRWDLRDDLRSISTLERVRKCGRVRVAERVGLRLSADGNTAGYAGLATCGSVWACPVCSVKVMTRRGLEIAAVLDWWFAQGGRVLMVTGTVRHHAGLQLAALVAAVIHGWTRVRSGKAWITDRRQLGIVGFVRALEVLHNLVNGWHPHIHALLLVDGATTEADAARFGARFFTRWSAGLEAHGFDALPIGQECHLVTREAAAAELGRYLQKVGLGPADALGYEMTSTHSKSGRSVGRTQWELAESATAGTAADVLRWKNFEFGTHGRRQLDWSRGLRDLAGVGQEASDEAIAGEELGSTADTVGWFTAEGWDELWRRPGMPVTLLRVAEQGGWAQVATVLDAFGIGYINGGNHNGEH